MNILVTGSNGQLGTHLGLLAEGSERNLWMFCDIDTLDITNETDVAGYVEKNEIDCIVNQYSGKFNNPFVAWARYRKGWFKTTLPISFQFHHVQMDGGHAVKFLQRLQNEIRTINP